MPLSEKEIEITKFVMGDMAMQFPGCWKQTALPWKPPVSPIGEAASTKPAGTPTCGSMVARVLIQPASLA